MQPEVLKLLYDVQASLNEINEFLGSDRNFKKYIEDKMLQRAVERNLEIIGEAINRLSKLKDAPKIINDTKIIGLRNRIIHAYDAIDNHIIWSIINRDLPKLTEEINMLLINSSK